MAWRWAVVLALLLPGAAHAAATVVPPNFEALLSTTLNALHTAGVALAGTLIPLGEQLTGVFFAVMFAWAVIEGTMAGNLEQMFKKLFNQMMIAGIVFEILQGWTDSSGINIFGFVTTGLNQLITPFYPAGGGTPSDTVVGVYWKAIQSIYGILNGVLNDLSTHNPIGGFGGWIKAMFGVGKGMSPLTLLVIAALVIVVVLVCVSILVIALLYSLLYTNLGDFIIYLGMAVGPVFVATLIFPPASHYFNKWLEFVISGGIYKLVAVAMISLLAGVFSSVGAAGTQIVTLASGTFWWNGLGAVFTFVLYSIVLIFWCLFAYFLTKQIAMFAHALAGGVNLHAGSLSSLVPAHLSNLKLSSGKESGGGGSGGGGSGGGGSGGGGGEGGGSGGEGGEHSGAGEAGSAETGKYREMTKQELAENMHKVGAAQEFRDRMHKIKRRKALASMKGGLTDNEEENEG